MRELAKALGSCTWALSLFGARQMMNLMSPSGLEEASRAFDDVTHAAEGHLDQAWQQTFKTGDDLQRRMTDMMLGAVPAEAFNPGWWLQQGSEMVRRSAEMMSQGLPGSGGGSGAGRRNTGWGPMPPTEG